MKRYIAQPGVVLVDVAGEHLLIATGQARGKCEDVTQLNDAGAALWRIIIREGRIGPVVESMVRELGYPKNRALPVALGYMDKLVKSGHMVGADVP